MDEAVKDTVMEQSAQGHRPTQPHARQGGRGISLFKQKKGPEQPMLERQPPLTRQKAALHALLTLIAYIFIPAVCLWFGQIAVGAKKADDMPQTISDLFSTIGFILAIMYIAKYYHKRRVSFTLLTGFRRYTLSKSQAAYAVLAGALLGFAVSAALTIAPLPEAWKQSYDQASLASFQGDGQLIPILLAVVFAPLCEELFFRGILYRTLARGFTPGQSAVISAAVFALLHIHPLWVVYAFLFGLLFGRFTARYESLTPALCLHVGVNLSASPGMLAKDTGWYNALTSHPLILAVVMIASAAVAANLLKRLYNSSTRH